MSRVLLVCPPHVPGPLTLSSLSSPGLVHAAPTTVYDLPIQKETQHCDKSRTASSELLLKNALILQSQNSSLCPFLALPQRDFRIDSFMPVELLCWWRNPLTGGIDS